MNISPARRAGADPAESALLTVPEFCRLASVGRTVAYSLMNSGQIQAVKIGRGTRIKRDSANAWLANLPVRTPARGA